MHAPLLLFASLSLIAINGSALAEAPNLASSSKVTLRIFNSEDYIANGDEGSIDVISLFKDYVKATDGVDIEVVYDTFDTNETMLSKLQTGSANYDLICPSDYVVQKLMGQGELQPFAHGEEERKALYGSRYAGWETDYYEEYASSFVKEKIEAVYADVDGVSASMGDYMRGYMWGTLGIMYNPAKIAEETGLSEEDAHVQINGDWRALWSDEYKNLFQIKDSMRDTFAMGMMYVYDTELKTLLGRYQSGAIDEKTYSDDINAIFNAICHIDDFNELMRSLDPSWRESSAEDVVDAVQNALIELKSNCFGFEVDSGKTDILDGEKSLIGLSWSGDAAFAITEAESDYDQRLYYAVPHTGSNVWFDGWMMPKTSSNQEYANKFIDFISRPDIAAGNMDYIGYTTVIAGDDEHPEMLDYIRSLYDSRTSEIYAYDNTADDFYYDEEGEFVNKDGTGLQNVEIDGETHIIDFGDVDYRGSDYDAVKEEGTAKTWAEKAEELGWTAFDLSYFYDQFPSEEALFYTDELEKVTGKNIEGEEETLTVGRSFLAQFPTSSSDVGSSLDIKPGLSMMEDYGDNNDYVVRMWENVKSSGSIQPWIIVIIVIEVIAFVLAIALILSRKALSKKLRKKRREERASS